MTSLSEWAARWRLPQQALDELCAAALYSSPAEVEHSEAWVQSRIRLEAAAKRKYLFRNNVGAGKMKSGGFIRFGLANDTERLNDDYKSADLIGLEPVRITADMVGQVIGRFLSVEVKHSGWKFSGTAEEVAQVAWATLVNAQGGRAIITNSEGAL